MATVAASVIRLSAFLSELSTVEWRIVASAAIVGLAVILGLLLFPFVFNRLRQRHENASLGGPLGTVGDLAAGYTPISIGVLVVRVSQLLVFSLAGLALLTVWRLITPASELLATSGVSRTLVFRLGVTAVLAGVVYVLADQYKQAIARIGQEATWMTDHQQEIVVRMGQLVILLFGALVVLGLWKVNLQGLLVGAGFLGIVVGLAARQTLGSLIAGFVLMFSRPFTIGDWVEIGGEEGVVTDITIVNTRLENFDGEVVVIPNDQVGNEAIVNRSKRGVLRLRVDVGIDYDSDPEHAKSVAMDAIKAVDSVADAPPPQIVPKAFGDSAVVLEMRFWIDHPTPPRKWNAISGVVTHVKAAFEREGITIPFPQRELSGRAETRGFQIGATDESVDGTPADEGES
ncbi:MAG: mechanosensitive ion channel family protein [Halorhabdus sp.]